MSNSIRDLIDRMPATIVTQNNLAPVSDQDAAVEPAQMNSGSCTSYGYGGSPYDAANCSPARSDLGRAFPLTARLEMQRLTRLTILQKKRALEANFGLIGRMRGQVRKYAVGAGIFPVPQTNSPAWNVESRAKFMDWANNPGVCDVAAAMTFWERQGFHAETFFDEGESFDALISSSVSGSPMLQLFDNTEIGSSFAYGPDAAGYLDGVKVNGQNRPISYLVATQSPQGNIFQLNTQEISAGDMIHIIRRKRANQLRAISPLAPGINPAIDRLDLRTLTTAAAKLHEALGIVVKKKSGEAGKAGISGKLVKQLDADGKVTQVRENFFNGANVQYLGLDEEIEVLNSDRPTQNLREFGNDLIRDICLGTGLSFEIVWNMAELGGATARIALADAQWFFDGIQDTINDRFNQRVWVWWCASMMKSGQLSLCPDPRWWNCHWQGPAKLTADEGYTAQAQVERFYSGQDNWQEAYARRGRAWQPVVKQRIDELKWLNAECETAGVGSEPYLRAQARDRHAPAARERTGGSVKLNLLGTHSASLAFAELEVRRTRLRAHRAVAHLDVMKELGVPPAVRLARSHVEQSVPRFPVRSEQTHLRNSELVMKYSRILSHLFSQPLFIEQNSFDAFRLQASNVDDTLPQIARACGCDGPVNEPAPRYLDVLELMRLGADVSQSFNGDVAAMPNDTAIITFEGLLVKHADPWECRVFGLTDLDDIDAALAHVAADANIRNVLLNFVNVPGGTIIGVPETAALVARLNQSKQVITFTDSQCTSAGIFIGSQAYKFLVTASAHTGSIGVIRPPILDFSQNLKMNGIAPTIIKSGRFKDTGTQLRPPTQEEIDYLQAYCDRGMKMFTDAVKAGRPRMSAAHMEAQIFFGVEAVEVGLSDAVVADLAEALAAF